MMIDKINKFPLFVLCIVLLISCNNNTATTEKDNPKKDSTIKYVSEERKPVSNDSSSAIKENVNDDKRQSNTSSTIKSDSLKVVKATSQKWAGGARGSGTGTFYCFTFIANYPSKQLTIDEVWIGQKSFKVIQSASPVINKTDFNKNDSVYIKVNDILPGEINRAAYNQDSIKKATIAPPFNYNGTALIGYLENNKRKFLAVDGFKILPRLNYP